MKRFSLSDFALSVLVLLLLAVSTIQLTGCANTSAATISYRTIASVKLAVDSGMTLWADRVIDGKATPLQELRVRTAFNEYKAAAKAAATVMRAETDPAPPNLTSAADALIGLLGSFGVTIQPQTPAPAQPAPAQKGK